MTSVGEQADTIQVTAPNGVTWTRRPGAGSTRAELLQALADWPTIYDLYHQWNWWQEGRRDQEHDRLWRILHEWDNGAPATTAEEAEAFARAEMEKLDKELAEERQRRADLAAESYDEERENLRLRLLQTESDAAFFRDVLEAPASPAQRENAERRLADRHATAEQLRRQLDDPEQIIDRHGFLPLKTA